MPRPDRLARAACVPPPGESDIPGTWGAVAAVEA